MKKFESVKELIENIELIPEIVGLDVMCRIQDWVLSGGSMEDVYVKRNLEFASKFINYKED